MGRKPKQNVVFPLTVKMSQMGRMTHKKSIIIATVQFLPSLDEELASFFFSYSLAHIVPAKGFKQKDKAYTTELIQ